MALPKYEDIKTSDEWNKFTKDEQAAILNDASKRGVLNEDRTLPPKSGASIKDIAPSLAEKGIEKGGEKIWDTVTGVAPKLPVTSTGGPSLSIGSQASNVLNNQPLQSVGSATMPDGSAGTLLSDGSVVPANSITFGDVGGTAAMVYNGIDAAGRLIHGNKRGKIQGGATLAGTGIGYALGGPVGGGIGSVVGRFAGRGLAHMFGGNVTGMAKDKRTEELSQMGYTPDQLKLRTDPDKTNKHYGEVPTADRLSRPTDVWGSQGLMHTFGSDYLNKKSEQDRFADSQAAIDNGLIKSDKGDVVVTDEAKLRDLSAAAEANPDYIKHYQHWKSQQPDATPAATPAATPNSQPQTNTKQSSSRNVPIGLGSPASLADVAPKPITPPMMPEPDDTPSPGEANSVNNYAAMINNMLKQGRNQFKASYTS